MDRPEPATLKDQKNMGRTESVKSIEGYVGFANLPNQVYRKSVKRGFEFTLMLVGKLNRTLNLYGTPVYSAKLTI